MNVIIILKNNFFLGLMIVLWLGFFFLSLYLLKIKIHTKIDMDELLCQDLLINNPAGGGRGGVRDEA